MYCLLIFPFLSLSFAEMTVPGIERTVSEGVNSMGFNVLYGDESFMVINEVVNDAERFNYLKPKTNINEALPPLPAEDVKCLMSVDRHCSKEMLEIKNVLIQALKKDCTKCALNQKEKAGSIVASMMVHDPNAWKVFLTRSALQILPEKKSFKEDKPKFKIVGKPEHVESSKKVFKLPGVKVRVKRYAMEKIN